MLGARDGKSYSEKFEVTVEVGLEALYTGTSGLGFPGSFSLQMIM